LSRANKLSAIFIVLELLVGIILGSLFLRRIDNNEEILGKTIGEGTIVMFGGPFLIFLICVCLIGIVGAVANRQNARIFKAIFYALFFGFLSLFLSGAFIGILSIAALFIPLPFVILGFYHGLYGKPSSND
jgi:hypothetical protein